MMYYVCTCTFYYLHLQFDQIPLLVSEITEENHPVEVGLSDSFYVDVPIAGSGGPGE